TPQEIDPGTPVVVHDPKVHVRGRVGDKASKDKLSLAEWSVGDGARKGLAGFTKDREPAFDLDEEVTLEPKVQTLRFLAKAGNSEERLVTLTLDFRPRPAEVVLSQPAEPLVEGRAKAEYLLEGRIALPPGGFAYPFETEVLVNGAPLDKAPDIDEKARTLKA